MVTHVTNALAVLQVRAQPVSLSQNDQEAVVMGIPWVKRRASTLLSLCLASTLVVAVGCGGGSSQNAAAADTLVIDQVSNISTLDPAQAFDVTAANALLHTYDTLVSFKGETLTEVVPRLAESFEGSPDAKTYTFRLKPDVTFSDGTPMTSQDVVFSFNRLKNLKASPSYLMDGLAVSAPDDATVVVTSETPRPELPVMLTSGNFSVINAAEAKKLGASDGADASSADKAGPEFDKLSMGTGQYVLESYEPNSRLVLKANDKYWGEQPTFTRLIFRSTSSPQQQSLNVQNGDADVALNLPSPMAADVDKSKVQVHSGLPPEVVYIALTNLADSPTANADFRRAVALGIDYDGLLQLAGPGSVQGTGLIPRSVTASLPEEFATKRDVETARAALAASGQRDAEIVLEYGSDYKVGGLDMGTFAQRIASSLAEVGVKVTLKPGPTAVTRTRYQEGKTQAAMYPYPPDYPDPSQFLIYNPGGVLGKRIHWLPEQDPQMLEMAKRATNSTDDAHRVPAFQEWDEALKATNHFIPVLSVAANVVADKNLTGVNYNPALGTNFGEIGRG